MWSTKGGLKAERGLSSDVDNPALIVIGTTKSMEFNPWGRPRPPVPIAQDVSYVADGELLAHQRVDSSRHLPAGRHQVVVIVTWERGQRASQAFDLTIPPTTSAPIALTETPASVA